MTGKAVKRKASSSGSTTSKTKKARSKFTRVAEPAPDAGGSGEASKKGGRQRKVPGIAPDDVDESAKPTQRAFQRHIRMLCGLLSASEVLGPADKFLDHYDKRFNEVEDMKAQMQEIVEEVKKPNAEALKRAQLLIKEARAMATGGGRQPGLYGNIAQDIAKIPAEHIGFAFGAITRAGLKTFHPDVFGAAHSTYNQLHRHLAASTFNSIVSWYGYVGLQASLFIAADYHLLCEMYDNFVFGTLQANSRKEFYTPGSLVKSQQQGVAEQRRGVLCENRYKEAKAKGYRKEILRLVNTEAAHSDDERLPGGNPRTKKGFVVHMKEGRNPIVAAFFYDQDRKIAAQLERRAKHQMPEPRIYPQNPTPSHLSRALPIGVPIDYFTPEFYNNTLTLQEKAMYVKTGVAFPLGDFVNDEHHDDWAKMKRKDFMQKYGSDVLKQYNIPTAEELATLERESRKKGKKKASATEAEEDDEEEEITDLDDTDDEEGNSAMET